MHAISPVGKGAAAKKYDLITALGAYALSRGKSEQRLVLRLTTLVTARYNWQRDQLAVGQREIARLWSCDERTVKREMAKLRAMGWLRVHRQGARGRVTEYGLAIDSILAQTSGDWSRVGPDFEQRLSAPEATDNVVPLRGGPLVTAPKVTDGDDWSLVQGILHGQDPATFASWLHALKLEYRAGGRLTLRAPSRFHAAYVETHLKGLVLAAFSSVDPAVSQVSIIA
ncbi:hypothetical protein [Anianabacter salinae]|uniref:hypothetical protein n=1 Tax=Anianabacter salinae TaxID=2851023 RepID=UPI00225DFAD5|nr:hypothetical protein [Anianabacter salinae]MBV0914126.1 hypothetical protein [Anianabacter salinae]